MMPSAKFRTDAVWISALEVLLVKMAIKVVIIHHLLLGGKMAKKIVTIDHLIPVVNIIGKIMAIHPLPAKNLYKKNQKFNNRS